jgi:hypothetical protein
VNDRDLDTLAALLVLAFAGLVGGAVILVWLLTH